MKTKRPSTNLYKKTFKHLKHHLARLSEALVFNKSKRQIFNKSTKYQIGEQSGHCPEEYVFSLKSLIGLKHSQGDGVILNLVDIVSFFDMEDLVDVSEALESMQVTKKVLRVWYKLNVRTKCM